MNTFGFAPLALCLALPAMAEDINETLAADPRSEISISNTAGRVEVRGWSRDEVEVTGTLGDDVEELIFERNGDEIMVKVKVPKRMFGRKDIASDLLVRVPRGSSLDVATVSASVDTQDVVGEQEIGSVSGSVTVQVFAADVEISTVSGSINAQGDGSAVDAELSSVSGSINVENLGGDLEAESVSGGISVQGGLFENIDMETVNGRIVLRSGLADNGDVDMESVNGSIDLEFSNAVPAEYNIETFNGSIRNCFGVEAERTSRYAPGYSLRYTAGAGTASVYVETLNGSIRFCAG